MSLNVLTTYANKWVAFRGARKEIVAVAPTIKKLDEKVKKGKMKDVVYHYVLPFEGSFAP